jgi:oligoribonuclease NrnB/cAMP/cGMP phosphodiesterase (DHH superfamily)
MASSSNLEHHKLTRFFFIISVFITTTPVLAVYTTIMTTHYGIKQNDMHTEAMTHLVKSHDWWNNYQVHKLREKIFQVEVDNLNNTLNQLPTSASHQQRLLIMQTLSKYQSYLSKLHANKSITDSLASLANKAQTEEKSYEQSIIAASDYSNLIEAYDFVTILLIVGVGLGGISEIAKNKLLGYASLVVGGFGVIVLLLITFTPIITYL